MNDQIDSSSQDNIQNPNDDLRNPIESSNFNQQVVEPQINNVIPLDQPPIDSKGSKKKIVVFVSGIVALVLVLVAGAYYLGISKSNDSEIEEQVMPMPTEVVEKLPEDKLVYLKEKELWTLDEKFEEVKLTNTDQSVFSFDYSPSGLITYIVGNKVEYGNGTGIEPNSIHLLLPTGEDREIFKMDITKYPNQEYELKVRDSAISDDGKLVIFTTSDTMYTYDVSSKKSEIVFYKPQDELPKVKDGIYGYGGMIIAPNNKIVYYNEYYYEGNLGNLINLETKVNDKLPQVTNGYIGQVMGFTDNENILIRENNSGEPISLESNGELHNYNILSKSMNVVGKIESDYAFYTSYLSDSYIYLPTFQVYSEEKTIYTGLFAYDLEVKSLKTLDLKKQLYSDPEELTYSSAYPFNDEMNLALVVGKTYKENNMYKSSGFNLNIYDLKTGFELVKQLSSDETFVLDQR